MAARQLHLTQSALSVLMRELEKELGVVLLDRSTRKVSLTEVGRDVLPSVRAVLGDLFEALSYIGELRDKRRGVLRVAASPLMACALLPQLIARWKQNHPDLEVRILDTPLEFLLERLHASEAEIAIGPDIAQMPYSGDAPVSRLTLFSDQHLLVCPKDHPLTKKAQVTWAELNDWPLITPTLDFMARLEGELKLNDTAGSVPRPPAYSVSYMTTAIGMVANGLGVTICPTYARALVEAHELKMVVIGEPTFSRDICVYQLARRSSSPAASSFVADIRSWCS